MRNAKLRSRRFTIADGMVLIAATALGLAWTGRAWPRLRASFPSLGRTFLSVMECLTVGMVMCLPCLVFWTLAMVGLRARQPRPRRSRAFRQPGSTATLNVSLVVLVLLPLVATLVISQHWKGGFQLTDWNDLPIGLMEIFGMVAPIIGLYVLASWMALAIQGQWRNEASWIDRVGRVLGVIWIIVGAFLGWIYIGQVLI